MKVYEIVDGENKLSEGCLLYFEKEKSFIIELQNYLDKWTAPLLFSNTVKNGKYTIGRELSYLWVKERVIPSGRQNIDSILANAKMPVYDEMTLLYKVAGKCSQDSLYIRKMDYIPDYILKRMEKRIVECVPCGDFCLLCFFADETVRKVDLRELPESGDINKIISNINVYNSVHIAAGGYCVTFNDSLDIEANMLYENGIKIPLSLKDFFAFLNLNVLDSSEVCDIFECTRQNLKNYLVKNTLKPIKYDVSGNLYSKGNVYCNEINSFLNKKLVL